MIIIIKMVITIKGNITAVSRENDLKPYQSCMYLNHPV